ncbi:unnamed protein product [Peniophora sp. CBMAI 1063]|nr:unnamed protein product [Peniophora sp. CBMAI 1063]
MHTLARRRLASLPQSLPKTFPKTLPQTRRYAQLQPKPTPQPEPHAPPPVNPEKSSDESALTRYLRRSPRAAWAFFKMVGFFGADSKKQVAGRQTRVLYLDLCAPRAEEDAEFWKDQCHLPPTFQSWFTVTNLHVWILTTRLRALPSPHADLYVQDLCDHFFLDIEDRMRHVVAPELPPGTTPADEKWHRRLPDAQYESERTSPSSPTFYQIRKGPRGKYPPEAFVTRQMKLFREQYHGLLFALDLALAHNSDAELGAALWRNILGGRGARGIPYPGANVELPPDDLSGVNEFDGASLDKYVRFPETIVQLVKYVRAEVTRLAELPDDEVMVQPGEDMQILYENLMREGREEREREAARKGKA